MTGEQVLAMLAPRERQVMALKMAGQTTAQIAASLGVSKNNVWTTLYNARRRAKEGGPPCYAKCQFGHAKKTGRACPECMRAARSERIEPGACSRVERELAEGKRCTHRMWSGRPCGLLLPCVHA